MIGPAVLLVCTGYITCHTPYIAVAVLSIALGLSGFQFPGVMVNHVDIAPPFAGILFGMSNTAATLSGVFAPYVVGRITTHVRMLLLSCKPALPQTYGASSS